MEEVGRKEISLIAAQRLKSTSRSESNSSTPGRRRRETKSPKVCSYFSPRPGAAHALIMLRSPYFGNFQNVPMRHVFSPG